MSGAFNGVNTVDGVHVHVCAGSSPDAHVGSDSKLYILSTHIEVHACMCVCGCLIVLLMLLVSNK